MNRLVVGIDFSKGALHAFRYALKMAEKTKADIRLVWVDNLSSGEAVFNSPANEIRTDAKQNIEELLEEYKDYKGIGKLDYRLMKGKVGHELSRHAREFGADYIIVGTHGITGFEEYWIGSNANRVVIYAHCPVITVRYDYPITDCFSRFLVPIDSTRETVQKLPHAVHLAGICKAEIWILGVYTTSLQSMNKKVDKLVADAEQYVKNHSLNYNKDCIKSDNIARDVIAYSGQNLADMIAIMTDRESATSNMLLGEYAHKIVNHSTIPVLNVRAQDNFKLE
ncbi:MAG: universal stress protein [Bacteroidales bacterium]|nr:universal stress protein [Bacteroidales bacterium]